MAVIYQVIFNVVALIWLFPATLESKSLPGRTIEEWVETTLGHTRGLHARADLIFRKLCNDSRHLISDGMECGQYAENQRSLLPRLIQKQMPEQSKIVIKLADNKHTQTKKAFITIGSSLSHFQALLMEVKLFKRQEYCFEFHGSEDCPVPLAVVAGTVLGELKYLTHELENALMDMRRAMQELWNEDPPSEEIDIARETISGGYRLSFTFATIHHFAQENHHFKEAMDRIATNID